MLGAALSAGVPELFGPSLGVSVSVLAQRLAAHGPHTKSLELGRIRRVDELAPSRFRTELSELVADFGDMCVRPFDLRQPRWHEDLRELLHMLAVLADAKDTGRRLARVRHDARAAADSELGRFEPYLRYWEKRLVQQLIDRCRKTLRLRATVDRQVYRTLALLRSVFVDVDRRLRRIEPHSPAGGVFHCSVQRLVTALTSGRPELGRIIAMRQIERQQQSQLAEPPICFRGGPPLGPRLAPPSEQLRGIGVSPGVYEGTARLLTSELPPVLQPGEIIVQSRADPALSPLYLLAGALLTDRGGTLELGAEVAREYALPTVLGTQYATRLIRDGQRLRIDGDQGTVQMLDL